MKTNQHDQQRRVVRSITLITVTVFTLLTCFTNAMAQWTQPDGGGNINSSNTGNVGIGTSAPAYKFELQSPSRYSMAVFGDGDTVGYAGISIAARTTTNIATNRTSQFNFSMRKDSWFGGDGSGPSLVIEAISKVGGYVAPFIITPTNNVILNGGQGASGLSYGNVGIGTTNPATKLDVNGTGKFEGNGAGLIVKNSNGWSQLIASRTGASQAAFIAAPSATINTANPYWAMGLSADGSTGWSLDTWDGANLITRMRMLPGGDIGIGTAAPASARLHVYSPGNTYLRIGAPLANQSSIAFNDDTNGQDIVLYRPDGTRDFAIWTATSSNVFRVMQSGAVGLGTNSPGYKLDVQGGQINASGGLCMAGVCKTAWSEVTGGSSQWTTTPTGSNLYYTSGNVGIGSNNPGAKLDVRGGADAAILIGDRGFAGSVGLEFLGSGYKHAGLRFDGDNLLVENASNSLVPSTWYNGQPMNFIVRNGNVGAGTTAPAERLEVNGNLKLTGTGNITASGTIEGGVIKAKYQDVAEWVESSQELADGTVVVLDSSKTNQVVASNQSYDTRVAGVISAQPGITLGEKSSQRVLVATMGRVRVKVDASRAPIQIGDLLVTSDVAGFAMKSEPVEFAGRKMHMPGTIIGKALEPLARGSGEILVLLSLQ